MMQAARDAGVKRFVFASSAAVYGSSPELPKHENMQPCPSSPYGFSKLATEHYGRLFSELYGMETVGLRYFNVLGPRQNPTSEYSGVIAKFVTIMLSGKAPTIYGDGLQTRDYVHVSNVVQANLLAATSRLPVGMYNVATGTSFTLLDVVRELNTLLGTNLSPLFGAVRTGDIRLSQADISAISQHGYSPQTDFKTGLADTVAWYRNQAL
jgi:UDP-glucose 4-epimerase